MPGRTEGSFVEALLWSDHATVPVGVVEPLRVLA
jgi:hypothetical protein